MREQDPGVKVGIIKMECDLHQVSNRTLSRYLNQSGLKYILPRRKVFSRPMTKERGFLMHLRP